MRILIAALLTAALVWLIGSPANLNNSDGRAKAQAVRAESPRKGITGKLLVQEKAQTELQPVSEPEQKTAVATAPIEQPVPQPEGCEAYRSLISQYNWNISIAMAVMQAESGCNPSGPPSPTCDRGLMQINCIHADLVNYDLDALYDPATNIRVAYSVYQSKGWLSWSTYVSGKYLKFL